MQNPHRSSVLITSCLKVPVDPKTRIPTTLYEREEAQPLRMSQKLPDAEENENDSDPDTSETKQIHYMDDRDSVIPNSLCGMSNEDYYEKIEELKNAHVNTMAILAKLYENKLCVRGMVAASEDPCESSVHYSSDKKNDVHLSYSTTEVDNTTYSSLSEISGDDQEKGGENLMSCGMDRIQGMWDGFSVQEYISDEESQKPGSSNLTKMKAIKKEQKQWSPKITIPQPFQMTLREAEKKKHKIKSRCEIEIENDMLRKQLEEEAECQRKFRANPVPAHTYIPLLEEIIERNEERRRFVKMRNKEILLAMQKPFSFLAREEKKKEIRKMQIKNLDVSVKEPKKFKAKPVPRYLYDQTISDRIKEEELYRVIRMKVRAQEILHSASLPKSMLHNTFLEKKKATCWDPHKELKFKPQINAKVPDFEMLHRKSQGQLMRKKNLLLTTVCEPFQLLTPHIPSKKEKILDDIMADENRLKETRWPYISCRNQWKSRDSITSSQSGSLDLEIIKITESAKKRKEAIRKSLEEKKKKEEQEANCKREQKLRERKLKKFISTRAQANDPHQSLAEVSRSKLKQYRNRQRKRTKEYLMELEKMQERVSRRPLLLEELTQRNARRAAERYYAAALKEQGLSEDFVSRKGHSVPGFILHSSNEDPEKNEHNNSVNEESSQEETDGFESDNDQDGSKHIEELSDMEEKEFKECEAE
ncbi:protein FAM161A isoform X1 [Carcharodon carcharias]|uniref:protein FAM161A isoform X1 n=1 Tax=Carcharodon carcharias TaxID=13397 RepID=UPI001B7E5A06|nr:protein FAM161A isoform X1 [Carcharodon carcharias]